MKKFTLALIVLVSGIMLIACQTDTTVVPVEFSDDTQVFALEALSASSLLNMPIQTALSIDKATNSATTTTDSDEEEPEVATSIDEINKYLDLMETFLGDDDLLNVEETASDNPDYEYMVTYSTVDILGETSVFVLYFNEVVYETDDEPTITTTTTTEEATTTEEETTTTEEATTTEEETTTPLSGTPDQEQEREYFFSDVEDDEFVTYYLSGILVHGDLVYNVEGKLISFDDEEVIRLYSYIDHYNYVRVQYRTEEGGEEEKFFYKVVEEGVVVSESKIRITNEDDRLNIRLELVEGNQELDLRIKLAFEDDVTIIKIMYTVYLDDEVIDEGHIKINKTIDPVTGEVFYDYKVLSGLSQKTFNYRKEGKKDHTTETTQESTL